MDDIILLAVNNIRDVLGEQSVSETDLNKFRQSLIRRVAQRYFPERDHWNSRNHQETKSNPASEFGNSKSEEQNIQTSGFTIQSTTSSSPVFQSKSLNSKLQSSIPTPDSSESVYFDKPSRLSPIPTSDSINFEKSLIPNNAKDPVIEKTFQTEHPTIHNPISQKDEAHYSLRSVSSYSSLGSVRKRQHPSSRPKNSSNLYDNSNYFSINTESLTSECNDVNYLPGKCANLTFSSHSPSSASSNSTVGFFRDPFSSDSDGTLIGSNATLSGQGNIQLPHKSSSFKINCSASLSSTVKETSNTSIRRMKSKASRGRKTSWWRKTRANKSKSKVTTSTNNSDRIEYGEHDRELMDNKTSLAQNDLHQSVSTLSNQPSTSSVIHTSININDEFLHNTNHVIHDHEDCDDDSSGSKSHTCKNTSRLSRKNLTTIKNNVNTYNKFVTKNSNVTKFTFDQNTPFALGSSANAWLGMGTARGRIYSKHPELFRYICDNEDKAWLVQTGLIISHGVKAYLVHAEQVHQIAKQINSYSSKLNNTVRTEKLKTFKLPHWFLQKVRVVASRHIFFSHITSSTELELINKETVTNEQDNSSTVDTSPPPLQSISLLSSPMTRTNIRKFKVDNSLSISNPIEINHSTIHNVSAITAVSSSKKIQNSPLTVSSSLSSSCSSSVTPKYYLATSSLQDYHEFDNRLISSDSNSLLNRNQTKLNCKSKIDNDTNNSVNTLHSQSSPNPPTLERFDYSTNR
ncbi:Deoxynucleotidyltransferase terminal-interacting protein isoform 1 [Schistosoma japonicum]|nr:Deoxynucleotidyltransferase terminal-interacting protein isoform 1 [Schistosoma japonicum]